jgi:prepilin-type N-terminal cleavage/methylation domain-containing protein
MQDLGMACAYTKGMLTSLARSDSAKRAGFSLIEMLVTVSMLAIMVGMAAPNVSRDISHSRVNGAAQVVAGDLEQALSLAGRQRRPVRVVVDASAKEIRLLDRVSGTLISRRQLGDMSEFKLYSVSGSPATVDLLPQGVATAPTIVTLSAGGYSRRVTMTRGGHVRVSP